MDHMEVLFNALMHLVTGVEGIQERLIRARAELKLQDSATSVPVDFRELYNAVVKELGAVEQIDAVQQAALAARIFNLWNELSMIAEIDEEN
jgi:hypothetical protein